MQKAFKIAELPSKNAKKSKIPLYNVRRQAYNTHRD